MNNFDEYKITDPEIDEVKLEGKPNPVVSEDATAGQRMFDAFPKLITEKFNNFMDLFSVKNAELFNLIGSCVAVCPDVICSEADYTKHLAENFEGYEIQIIRISKSNAEPSICSFSVFTDEDTEYEFNFSSGILENSDIVIVDNKIIHMHFDGTSEELDLERVGVTISDGFLDALKKPYGFMAYSNPDDVFTVEFLVKSSVTDAIESAKNDALRYALKAASSEAAEIAQAKAYEQYTAALRDAKKYSDDNLETANTYADEVAGTALRDAKAYTEEQSATVLSDMKSYTDEKAAEVLASATDYADRLTGGASIKIEGDFLLEPAQIPEGHCGVTEITIEIPYDQPENNITVNLVDYNNNYAFAGSIDLGSGYPEGSRIVIDAVNKITTHYEPSGEPFGINVDTTFYDKMLNGTYTHIQINDSYAMWYNCSLAYKGSMTAYVDSKVGDIETTLDAIIEIQNGLLGVSE